jgi:hypothetical protein
LSWIWAGAFVRQVVGAEVSWIKAAQVGSRKDEVGARASRIDIDGHALSRAGVVGERVLIVMMPELREARLAKGGTRCHVNAA